MDPISRRLVKFQIGDYVDITVDGSKHLGMPFKYYHGKTGKIFDVGKKAVGVVVNKTVRNKVLAKRLHVRIEHLKKSRCREDFLKRIKENDRLKREAKKAGKKISTKRTIEVPKGSQIVELGKTVIEYLNPKVYTPVY